MSNKKANADICSCGRRYSEHTDYGAYDIVKATQHGIFGRVKELVEAGYDVNQPDDEDVYLMHWAAVNNRELIMRYLMGKGAKINVVGGVLKATPLNWAARYGRLEAVDLLIRAGADTTLQDIEGCTCICVARHLEQSSKYRWWCLVVLPSLAFYVTKLVVAIDTSLILKLMGLCCIYLLLYCLHKQFFSKDLKRIFPFNVYGNKVERKKLHIEKHRNDRRKHSKKYNKKRKDKPNTFSFNLEY